MNTRQRNTSDGCTLKDDGISVTIEIGDGPGQVTREAWETAKAIWGLTEERPADD